MPRRKRENPLTEHIADFSDMEYDDGDVDDFIALNTSKKEDNECFDDSDQSWMYEYTEEPESCDDESEKTEDKIQNSTQNPVINSDIDKYMTAAVWFNEINKRGNMSRDEIRYVELMIIELSNFYFGHLKDLKPSKKCAESINYIYESIKEAGLCLES